MIQRIQTIWLLLAAVAGFFTTRIALYAGSIAGEVTKKYSVTDNLLLFAITILATIVAVVTIFLFKNRSTQMKLSALGFFLSVVLITLIVTEIGPFRESVGVIKATYYWGSLLPIAMAVFFIFAAINIRKDNKLIKSLDRLR